MFKKRNLILVTVLVILSIFAFSSVALGSVSVSVTPFEIYTYPSDDYHAQYTVNFAGDAGKYYMMEIWHDGNPEILFNNIPQYWWNQTLDDYWLEDSPGWHTAYFKFYETTGFNSWTKASGLLAQRTVSVYRY